MEIYKLSNEVPDERKRSRNKNGVEKSILVDDMLVGDVGDNAFIDSKILKITDLRQGVKNSERVNVFVNEKYAFSLDVAQVVDYKLKVGREISAEEFVELRKASEFGKLYQRTLEWTLMRPRSEREVRDYLRRKLKTSSSKTLASTRCHEEPSALFTSDDAQNHSGDISEFFDEIVERLVSRGYLDGRKFAEWYAENRFVKKGISQKRLRMELMKKGVTKEVIDEVLGERNDEEEIRKMIVRKRAKYDNEKLKVYLVRQGFSYDLVRKMVDETSE